jgi:hypothetical protein
VFWFELAEQKFHEQSMRELEVFDVGHNLVKVLRRRNWALNQPGSWVWPTWLADRNFS